MLYDESMLPKLKTQIPQMADLLQAEQAYLDVIFQMAAWLQGRTELLREEPMNLENMKKKIGQITGWDCQILEDPEHLTLTFRYYFDASEPILEQEKKIMSYVPAHLKIIHSFLQEYEGTRRIYVGGGLGNYVKYTGCPQEINGSRTGTFFISAGNGLCEYTKMSIYMTD